MELIAVYIMLLEGIQPGDSSNGMPSAIKQCVMSRSWACIDQADDASGMVVGRLD